MGRMIVLCKCEPHFVTTTSSLATGDDDEDEEEEVALGNVNATLSRADSASLRACSGPYMKNVCMQHVCVCVSVCSKCVCVCVHVCV
jgi:hypothetical protein